MSEGARVALAILSVAILCGVPYCLLILWLIKDASK